MPWTFKRLPKISVSFETNGIGSNFTIPRTWPSPSPSSLANSSNTSSGNNPSEVEARVEAKREEIKDEIADIGIYLTELADNLGIDLLVAMEQKIAKNSEKYPADRVKGSSKKYNEYEEPAEQ